MSDQPSKISRFTSF